MFSPLGHFTDQNDRFPYPSTSKIPTLSYTWSLKKVTLLGDLKEGVKTNAPAPHPPQS